MLTLIIFAILVGLDNFQAALAIGLLGIDRKRRIYLALAFGFFETLMSIIGLSAGSYLLADVGHLADYLGSIILGSFGIYIIYTSSKKKQTEKVFGSRWILLGLPLSLSFDNLFAGVGLGLLGFEIFLSAIVIGVISTSMSYFGLRLGSVFAQHLLMKSRIISGLLMLVRSVMIIIFN